MEIVSTPAHRVDGGSAAGSPRHLGRWNPGRWLPLPVFGRRVNAVAGGLDLSNSESPEFIGRAVAALSRDPAGDPMGLVEMEGAQPKVP